MTSKILLLFAIGLPAMPSPVGQHASSSRTAAAAELIARLGAPANDDVADIKELAKSPKVNTGLLVAALRVIPDSEEFEKTDSPAMEHSLELIRALRYITGGMDFCAQSKQVFGPSEEEKNRKYWLSFAHKDCLSFFRLWPSRGRIYIAPVDAQKNIISQWQHWYAAYGSEFHYKPLQNPAPESWLW